MKTTSRIFATLFIALGVFAAGAAIYGATHQWFIAGICIVVAFALLADAGKKIEATNYGHPRSGWKKSRYENAHHTIQVRIPIPQCLQGYDELGRPSRFPQLCIEIRLYKSFVARRPHSRSGLNRHVTNEVEKTYKREECGDPLFCEDPLFDLNSWQPDIR